MAETQAASEATQPEQPASPKPASLARRILSKCTLSKRTLGAIAVCSLALNVVGYQIMRARMQRTPSPPSPEIALGTFHFQSDGTDHPGAATARFTLHVSLLKEAEKSGRAQLADAKFRVQQDIEELLRRAHAADFEDPSLAELKRQLQEQVNSTLGTRAVSSVIITDLAFRRSPSQAAEPGEAASRQHAAEEPTEPNPHEPAPRHPLPSG